MTIDRKNTKTSAVSNFYGKGKGHDVLSKEEIDHVLGNHKGARDHLLSTEWTTGKNVNRLSLSE